MFKLFNQENCHQCYCCDDPSTFLSITEALSHIEYDIVVKNEFSYIYKCPSCRKFHDCNHAVNRKIEVYI